MLCENHHRFGNTITVQSDINPRATVASIKVLFRGIKALTRPRFALSRTHALGILHYPVRYIAPVQGILPVSQLDATVRAAFMPDVTMEFLPTFSIQKCVKSSVFSRFYRS